MLLPANDTRKLTSESYTRLELFYRRFCEGPLRRQYGLGHMIYACHAAFPMILSPELANVIWINFNNYPYNDGSAGKIEAIAVSDFLLSPLCRQISNRQYEVYPEIRSYLLHLLKEGAWFDRYGIKLNGEERLNDLADLLEQYVVAKSGGNSHEGAGFKQLNEWAALAYKHPGHLASLIGEALEKSSTNDQSQLWLSTQIEKIEKQFSLDIHNHGSTRDDLRPFFNLYYYTQARKGELFGKAEKEVFGNSSQIKRDVTNAGVRGTSIRVPLTKNLADRTERKINKVQRVLSLIIAIDTYKTSPLQGSVYGTRQVIDALQLLNKNPETGLEIETRFALLNEAATKKNIFDGLSKIFSTANAEDTCLIFFSGHGSNTNNYTENKIVPFDFDDSKNNFGITNSEFFEAIQQAKALKPCHTVLIVDSHVGYYQWLSDTDVFLGAVRHTMQTEQRFDGENLASAFSLALRDILLQSKGKIAYRHLLLWLRFKIENDYGVNNEMPVLMTAAANLNHSFLRDDPLHVDDAPVAAYNKSTDAWQVLDEDFKLLTLSTNSHLKEYSKDQKVENAQGELFIRNDEILFGGHTTGLDKTALYKVYPGRKRLPLFVTPGSNTSLSALRKTFQDLRFNIFSKWHSLELLEGEERGDRDDVESLTVEEVKGPYSISYRSIDPATDTLTSLQFTVHAQQLLAETIHRFALYHYLWHLSLPQRNYKRYDPLQVDLQYRWEGGIDTRLLNIEDLRFDETSFTVHEDRLVFHPLELVVRNDEAFPIFFELYWLFSDLSIVKIGGSGLVLLPPEGSTSLQWNDQQILDGVLSRQLSVQLKLLTSCDPIQHDFSQAGYD